MSNPTHDDAKCGCHGCRIAECHAENEPCTCVCDGCENGRAFYVRRAAERGASDTNTGGKP
jgi:hypothetical protein